MITKKLRSYLVSGELWLFGGHVEEKWHKSGTAIFLSKTGWDCSPSPQVTDHFIGCPFTGEATGIPIARLHRTPVFPDSPGRTGTRTGRAPLQQERRRSSEPGRDIKDIQEGRSALDPSGNALDRRRTLGTCIVRLLGKFAHPSHCGARALFDARPVCIDISRGQIDGGSHRGKSFRAEGGPYRRGAKPWETEAPGRRLTSFAQAVGLLNRPDSLWSIPHIRQFRNGFSFQT